ncbi:hypothetical protein ACFY12_14075 [Streptomyces sp. NPDC001339]|uniref:hypothetical protein n=1 Tax=Streptomyces sp. NPDC001339 TaxID=3364563 RepID=UPI0036747D8B
MTLRLAGAAHRAFEGRPPAPADPFLVRLYADMAELYGTTFDQERLERANRNTFSDLAEGLLDALPALEEPIDLVVVASDRPDFDPRTSGVSYLTETVPGTPLAFSLSDQGEATPYTALRLAGQYAAAGRADRVLVTAMDQTTSPADPEPPRQGPEARDGAAALLLSADGPGAPTDVRQYPGLTLDEAYGRLGEVLDGGVTELIVGTGLTPERITLPSGAPTDVVPASSEFPCTGAWGRLAAELPRFIRDGGTVVVADYVPHGPGDDTGRGELALCVVDFGAAAA